MKITITYKNGKVLVFRYVPKDNLETIIREIRNNKDIYLSYMLEEK